MQGLHYTRIDCSREYVRARIISKEDSVQHRLCMGCMRAVFEAFRLHTIDAKVDLGHEPRALFCVNSISIRHNISVHKTFVPSTSSRNRNAAISEIVEVTAFEFL